MRLGDPNPETRYDWLRWAAKKTGVSVADVYKQEKQTGLRNMVYEMEYHFGHHRRQEFAALAARPNPFFALIKRGP